MPGSSISQQLEILPTTGKTSLCRLWRQLFQKQPVPGMRPELMVRVLAHRLQEQEFGGLAESSSRRLRQLADTFAANPTTAIVSTRPTIKPGTRLVRQWKDKVHVVEARTNGYEYKGTRYESLSEIARLITSTRWSGPLFFGLRKKSSVAQKEAQ
jgi:hypothetical protein